MALPTLVKTWQYNVNQAIAANASLATQCATLMYAIKASMIAIGTLPWQVRSANNGAGVFGNNDGVDRWLSSANLIWNTAGNNHSWIVLRQTGISANFSICIDLNKAAGSPTDCSIIMSPTAGFGLANGGVDGTATARPTATDEIVLVDGKWGCTTTANRAQKLHYMQSTDGQCNRVSVHSNSVNHMLWMFEKLNLFQTGWTEPYFGMIAASSSGAAFTTVQNLCTTTAPLAFGRNNTNSSSMCFAASSCQNMGANMVPYLQTFADEDSGQWPIFPVYTVGVTYPTRGYKGKIYDFWFGSTGLANGTQYPLTPAATRLFAHHGNCITPWDGSVIQIT